MTIQHHSAALMPCLGDEVADYELNAGILAHRLIGQLCASVPPASDPDRLYELSRAAARRLIAARPPRRGRDATMQRISMAAWRYLRDMRPPSAFAFVGAEVLVGRSRIDLVWRRPPTAGRPGAVLFDELKTGHIAYPATTHQRRQVSRAVADGRRHLGSQFVGLRLLSLTRTSDRYWISPTGRWSGLDASAAVLAGDPR